jgi:hypothetical protein
MALVVMLVAALGAVVVAFTYRQIVATVAAYACAVLALMVIAAYLLHAWFAETRLRGQLAVFPERNPHPVISMTSDGRVTYANPGAMRLLHLGAVEQDARSLLPPDMPARIERIAADGRSHELFEYETRGHVFACEVHALQEQGLREFAAAAVAPVQKAELFRMDGAQFALIGQYDSASFGRHLQRGPGHQAEVDIDSGDRYRERRLQHLTEPLLQHRGITERLLERRRERAQVQQRLDDVEDDHSLRRTGTGCRPLPDRGFAAHRSLHCVARPGTRREH